MSKYLASVVFVCLFALALPGVSSAAFLNYSGTLPNVSVKFSTFNVGTGRFDQVQRRAQADGHVFNSEVDFDHVTGRMTSDIPGRPSVVFGNAAIWLESINMLPAGGDKFEGNCRIEIRFFTGSVSYDPVLERYSGTGQVYRLEGGGQAMIMSDSTKKRGLLKVNRVMPFEAMVQNVTEGVVAETFTPAFASSIKLPAMQLELQPLP